MVRNFKSGAVSGNAFLNFLREYRQTNPKRSQRELSIQAGELWRNMSDCEKFRYFPIPTPRKMSPTSSVDSSSVHSNNNGAASDPKVI